MAQAHHPSPRISVCIPYFKRAQNLALALQALARQTTPLDTIEVVIGAMGADASCMPPSFAAPEMLRVTCAISREPFQISHARNLAMRAATGDLIVQMDADTFLAPDALERLSAASLAPAGGACCVGRVLGYDNNATDRADSPPPATHDALAGQLARLRAGGQPGADLRFGEEVHIPWAFVWTGLVAIPRTHVTDHDLYFDENFVGWGVDDLEWGYRIAASGVAIRLCSDAVGLHLPHTRSVADNKVHESRNMRRLVAKWQTEDAELVGAFNDIEANRLLVRYQTARRALIQDSGWSDLTCLEVRGADRCSVLLAVPVLADGSLDLDFAGGMDATADPLRYRLTGLALPLADGSADEVWLGPGWHGFPEPFRGRMLAEARRIASAGLEPLVAARP